MKIKIYLIENNFAIFPLDAFYLGNNLARDISHISKQYEDICNFI